MASHWTSKNAILRDLSVAQGREVPVEIVNPVTSNEKPPALNYTEETEEEFYAGCVGGSGDIDTGPDLQLIQQMLDMVREVDISDIDNKEHINTETIIEISKADAEIVSDRAADGPQLSKLNDNKKIEHKLKKKRNVAMASLIETYGNNSCINDHNENILANPKLLKPDDFISNIENTSNEPDSNNSGLTSYQIPIIQSPISMFKKKSPITKNLDTTDMFQKRDISPTTAKTENISEDKPKPGCFVPSSHAGERYKAYLEKSKLKEQVKEDIWARAERKMKEIDAKRKQDSLRMNLSPSSSSQDSNSSEPKGMDFVRLPQHRHLLTGDCTVCKVLCIHRKEDEQIDPKII